VQLQVQSLSVGLSFSELTEQNN